MVPLDAEGRVIRAAILWNDQRTGKAIAEIEATIPLHSESVVERLIAILYRAKNKSCLARVRATNSRFLSCSFSQSFAALG